MKLCRSMQWRKINTFMSIIFSGWAGNNLIFSDLYGIICRYWNSSGFRMRTYWVSCNNWDEETTKRHYGNEIFEVWNLTHWKISIRIKIPQSHWPDMWKFEVEIFHRIIITRVVFIHQAESSLLIRIHEQFDSRCMFRFFFFFLSYLYYFDSCCLKMWREVIS